MIRIERYGRRFWAVYEKGRLLCVTVYKKGANAVKARLEQRSDEVDSVAEPATASAPHNRIAKASAEAGTAVPSPLTNTATHAFLHMRHRRSRSKSFDGNYEEKPVPDDVSEMS